MLLLLVIPANAEPQCFMALLVIPAKAEIAPRSCFEAKR